MRAVSNMAVPGVYAPDEERDIPISDIQDSLNNDPEVGEAINDLVHSLEYGISKAKAFDAFEERVWFLYLRNRARLEDK